MNSIYDQCIQEATEALKHHTECDVKKTAEKSIEQALPLTGPVRLYTHAQVLAIETLQIALANLKDVDELLIKANALIRMLRSDGKQLADAKSNNALIMFDRKKVVEILKQKQYSFDLQMAKD